MIEEKRCPKCGRKEKVKNGFMREDLPTFDLPANETSGKFLNGI